MPASYHKEPHLGESLPTAAALALRLLAILGVLGLLLFVCVPVALGSGWGLVPGVAIGLLYAVRTCKEDQMLRQELAGYEAYTRHVRYRLVPGVW